LFNQLVNTGVMVSDVALEVPTLEVVARNGIAINVTDKLIYTIETAGVVVANPVSIPVVEELTGMRASITGRLEYIRLYALPYTLIRMDDIGNIVEPGDIVRLPYGVSPQVVFVSNEDTIGVLIDLPNKVFDEATVERFPIPLNALANPSTLSVLWSGLTISEDTVLVAE